MTTLSMRYSFPPSEAESNFSFLNGERDPIDGRQVATLLGQLVNLDNVHSVTPVIHLLLFVLAGMLLGYDASIFQLVASC